MSMLPDRELVEMRATAREVLPTTAVLSAATLTSDGQGGRQITYAPVGTVLARLAPEDRSREGEQVVGSRMAEVTSWILTLPHDTIVEATYRVTYASVVYEVAAVLHWDPWEISRRVRLIEVD